jgi:hypothetical protein
VPGPHREGGERCGATQIILRHLILPAPEPQQVQTVSSSIGPAGFCRGEASGTAQVAATVHIATRWNNRLTPCAFRTQWAAAWYGVDEAVRPSSKCG